MRLLPAWRNPRARSRGQAMVEFALVLPLLALLLVMAIDFGRVFFGWVALQNATRIAADYASERADAWPANNPLELQAQGIYRDVVENDLQAINCEPPGGGDWQTADVPDPTFPDGKDVGDPTVVHLECTFALITPLAELIVGGPVALDAEATFAIHEGATLGLPTPTPTPTPSPTPAITPSPAPTNCTVPATVLGSRNTARNLWAGNGFVPANLIEVGNGNFTVQTQSLTANSSVPCNSAMTIWANVVATPSPTPVPTATAVPTPTPPPTPSPTPACQTPVASFTASPATTGTSPLTVQFTDTSTPRNCPITTWTWNFGDGTPTVTTQNASHTFTHPGPQQNRSFTVQLTVSSAAGPAFTTTTITVRKP